MKKLSKKDKHTSKKVSKYLTQLRYQLGALVNHYPVKVTLSSGLKLVLSPIKASDIKDLLTIERIVYSGQLLWTKNIFLNELNQTNPHLYVKAQVENETVAFIGVRFKGSDAHVANLAVLPHYQHQGIASLLLSRVEKIARYYRCETLSLEVRQSNLAAQRLYRSLGFRSQRVLNGYYFDNNENGVYMEKDLIA